MVYKNLIGGDWVGSDRFRRNVNPSDLDEVIGEYAQATAADTDAAIASAHAASDGWAVASPQAKFDALDFVGTELLARADELGNLLAREEGKILIEAVAEVRRAGQIFKFFAGESVRTGGEQLASIREGVDVEVTREALGVVGLITPWNFPIAIPAWKTAAALAHGNCVVLKPADSVPASAWALAEIISRSPMPRGVFNLAMGRGRVVGQRLVEDARVAGISFTGSTPTGRLLRTTATERGAKLQLEMGGKNPLVVLDDANLDVAIECAVNGAFFSTGQRCTASSRLIVQKGIYSRFVAALAKRVSNLRVGHALDPEVQIGPVTDEDQLRQNLEYIKIGQDEGARLACGGDLVDRPTRGFFLQPALFVDADNAMRIAREEIFGPVACVIPADDFEHALALANDTPFGLSAGICTTSLSYARSFKRRALAGMVMVNLPTAGVDYHVPFGGRKQSSFGPREQGSHARDFFTIVKTSYIG
ncbi:aldehyde dehydrogenase family protein [Sphingopyxis sp. 22461]|uniref:aldehyde dehydrogenase family protein n=1 Tax=Sphingopyxis sp. 22461 TaxID=3453923 RepID=UPI003F84DC55